jgi:hypothetical protein
MATHVIYLGEKDEIRKATEMSNNNFFIQWF